MVNPEKSEKSLIFILGKNKELSIAEILSWLESRRVDFRIRGIGKYSLRLQVRGEWPNAGQLGGTIKIVEPLFECRQNELQGFMESMPIEGLLQKTEGNILFGLSLYGTKSTQPHMQAKLAMLVKKRLKEDGINARFMPSRPGEPWLTHVEIIKKGLIEKSADICVCMEGERVFIGRTEDVHNPFEFMKRDTARPFQRTGLGISPRLARILVNLSGARKALLDPFCGTGTILQEAALSGLEATGTDADPEAVAMCRENMKWLFREYGIAPERVKVFQFDAAKISSALREAYADGIAAEPTFGPMLRRKPTYRAARSIISSLEPVYFNSLRAMRKVLADNGRIAMTFPRFRTEKGHTSLQPERIAERTGFAVYDILEKYRVPHIYPVLDFEQRHRIMREVHVFMKA